MEDFNYSQYLVENKLFQEYWGSDDDALAQDYQKAEKKLANDFISWAKQNEGSREAPKQGTFFGDETLGDSAEINGQETYWNLCKSGLWKISQWQVPGLTNSKGAWCSVFSCTFPEILDAIKSLYRNGIQTQNSNMEEFNYQGYLSEGWLFKEAESAAADQWWNSIDPQLKKEVCIEMCGLGELKAAVAEWYGYYGSDNLSAEACEECYDEIWNELAPDEKQHYMDEYSQDDKQPL